MKNDMSVVQAAGISKNKEFDMDRFAKIEIENSIRFVSEQLTALIQRNNNWYEFLQEKKQEYDELKQVLTKQQEQYDLYDNKKIIVELMQNTTDKIEKNEKHIKLAKDFLATNSEEIDWFIIGYNACVDEMKHRQTEKYKFYYDDKSDKYILALTDKEEIK